MFKFVVSGRIRLVETFKEKCIPGKINTEISLCSFTVFFFFFFTSLMTTKLQAIPEFVHLNLVAEDFLCE